MTLHALRKGMLAFIEHLLPRRRVLIAPGDELPAELPWRDLVLVRDDEEDWSVGLRCPCGCGRRIELLLVKTASPRWSIQPSRDRIATLTPSVWLKGGCASHFFVRDGRIDWCRD